MTIGADVRLVKGMKLTSIQIERMVRNVFKELEENNVVDYKVPQEKAILRAIELVKGDYDKEREIEREAEVMLENIERQNQGGEEINRHKMFLMIKKKLAQEKGFVL